MQEDEIMSRKVKGERLPPFVALLKETLDTPAWRAMSHGARSLYVCLKRRYNSKQFNNGRLHVSQRQARKETGSGFAELARWFRELQHYGFIVMVKAGHLGLDGKGKAPHWRLTECGYMHDPPTRDFNKWNGVRFTDQKRRRKKQNPVTEICNGALQNPVTPLLQKSIAPKRASVTESCNIQAKSVLWNPVTFLVNHSGRAAVGGIEPRSMAAAGAATAPPATPPGTATEPAPGTATATAEDTPPVRVQLGKRPTTMHLHGAGAGAGAVPARSSRKLRV
jgi:hypothetical protein